SSQLAAGAVRGTGRRAHRAPRRPRHPLPRRGALAGHARRTRRLPAPPDLVRPADGRRAGAGPRRLPGEGPAGRPLPPRPGQRGAEPGRDGARVRRPRLRRALLRRAVHPDADRVHRAVRGRGAGRRGDRGPGGHCLPGRARPHRGARRAHPRPRRRGPAAHRRGLPAHQRRPGDRRRQAARQRGRTAPRRIRHDLPGLRHGAGPRLPPGPRGLPRVPVGLHRPRPPRPDRRRPARAHPARPRGRDLRSEGRPLVKTPKPLAGTALALSAAVALAGCSGPAADEAVTGGTLAIGLDTDITSLDPIDNLVAHQSTLIVGNAVYEPLFLDGPEGGLVPGLAESIETDDLTDWTLTLKPGLAFSDGSPLDAEAVIAHFERMADPESTCLCQPAAAQIDSAEAADDTTVRLTLAAPDAAFDRNLTRSLGMIR